MIPHQKELLEALSELKAENPWEGKIKEREAKINRCFERFKQILDLPDWKLVWKVPLHYSEQFSSGSSGCNIIEQTITLRGRISVLTFIHEVIHAMPEVGSNQDLAREYSEMLFELTFPDKWEKLHRTKSGILIKEKPKPTENKTNQQVLPTDQQRIDESNRIAGNLGVRIDWNSLRDEGGFVQENGDDENADDTTETEEKH